LPYWPIGWLVNRYIEKVIGFRFDDIAPIARLKNVTCPVLLIHGLQDDVVPIYCAEQLLESQPNAQLLRVEGTHEKFFDQDKLQVDVQIWLQHHLSASENKTSHIPFL
jgi:pimeloyl-ACP methyl ester carboxylesterase